MKFLMTTAALAMLVASPALAAPKHANDQTSVWVEGNSAYAYQMHDPDTVVDDNQIIGRDPDPSIRFQVLRDHGLLGD